MRLKITLSIVLLSFSVNGDQSCHSECFTDKLPTCATWLRKDISSDVGGIYELGKGVVNMSCSFASLPVPTTVSWVHKAQNSNSWTEFACSTKEENKLCSDSEHNVESRCILSTSDLNMSGSYRCQAFTKGDSGSKDSKAFGSESIVNVVGVSKLDVVESYLPYGQLGHIEIEVCANPKPEIFWLTSESILKSDERSHRMSATQLHHKKMRSSVNGPATIVPYCYTARLLVRKVHAEDEFQISVRTDGATRTQPLSVEVTGIPKAAVTAPFLSLFWAALSLHGMVF